MYFYVDGRPPATHGITPGPLAIGSGERIAAGAAGWLRSANHLTFVVVRVT